MGKTYISNKVYPEKRPEDHERCLTAEMLSDHFRPVSQYYSSAVARIYPFIKNYNLRGMYSTMQNGSKIEW